MSDPKKNQEFVLSERPKGVQTLKNIWKLQDCEYPKITQDGQYIAETVLASVDPYLSSSLKESALGGNVNPLGSVQVSGGLGRVIESKSEKYPVGTYFLSFVLPWRRYNLLSENEGARFRIIKKPDQNDTIFDKLGIESSLGSLGMPSQTAYYGVRDVGKFTEKDVVVVSGAAGAVGTIAGQITKQICRSKRVIGIAGGKSKCEMLVRDLGFDVAIDYKEFSTREKMVQRLKEVLGEDTITAYFDNTGGHTTEAVFDLIGRGGRIVVCGQISSYNDDREYSFPNYLAKTIYKALSIYGFVVSDFFGRNEKEFYPEMSEWVGSGKIKTKETIVEGFENLPRAYEMLFTGENTGKIIVKIK